MAPEYPDLSLSNRKMLEERFLRGDFRHDDLEPKNSDSLHEYKAWRSLKRLLWLKEQKCLLSNECLQKCSELQAVIPNQKVENIELPADSGTRFYRISPEYKYDGVASLNISQLIQATNELRGRNDDWAKDNKPFAGLALKHAWLAYIALSLSAEKGLYPEKAWCEFLSHHVRENAGEYPTGLIAELISLCPLDIPEEFIYTIAEWFNAQGKILVASYPKAFQVLLNRIIELFHHNTLILHYRFSETTETDWLNKSLNSPVGKTTDTLIDALDTEEVKKHKQLPLWWMQATSRLLSLDDSLSALATARLSCRLDWFYYISPSWTKAHLLTALYQENSDSRYAAWCGYLTAGQASYELMPEIKSALYKIAVDSKFRRSGFDRNIAGLILLDWESTQDNVCASNSNLKLKELLLRVDSHLLVDFLVVIESLSKDDDRKKDWLPLAVIFFSKVWPRQKCMRIPKLSARLFELIFSDKEIFKLLHPRITPKLTRVERANSLYISRLETENEIINDFPFEALQAFHKILPADAHNWPYDIGDTLQALLSASEDIQHAPEMIELKRKWDSL